MDTSFNDIVQAVRSAECTGLGDFSHGCANVWNFRLRLVRELVKHTRVNIFIEDLDEYVCRIREDPEIILSGEYNYRRSFPMHRYSAYQINCCREYLKFVRFVHSNRQNITITGVDELCAERDAIMAERILKCIRTDQINLYIAHNYHVGTLYDSAGSILRKQLGARYLIVQTAAVAGRIRYDSRGLFPSLVMFREPKAYPFQGVAITPGYRICNAPAKSLRPLRVTVVGFTYVKKHDVSIISGDYLVTFRKARPTTNNILKQIKD